MSLNTRAPAKLPDRSGADTKPPDGDRAGETGMAIDLDNPLDWERASGAERVMLQDLQGNILKGHGRRNTVNLFLNFGTQGHAKVRPILRSIGRQLPCALDQLRDAKAFDETKISSGRFLAFHLTSAGYGALGKRAAGAAPNHKPFRQGMLKRAAEIADPDKSVFDKPFRQEGDDEIHAMLLIAHDDEVLAGNEATRWLSLLSFGGIREVGRMVGLQHVNSAGEGIENFGYVDGRSQPLMLKQDIDKEPKAHWDPAFPLRQVLVEDPGGRNEGASFGSFFVFRKLEQNVERFKAMENELAAKLCLTGEDAERAGAMVVGRFEDGTPLVEPHASNQPPSPVPNPPNDFNFKGDPDGALCPFRAHIRKTNPRGQSATVFGIPEADERSHIMARRGITYGEREQNPENEFTDFPTGGVGLLFMAYMNDIANQFEFTQNSWANNPDFLPSAGVDPVIAQGVDGTGEVEWPSACEGRKMGTFDFRNCVTPKGGEYFFAPSKSFLTSL